MSFPKPSQTPHSEKASLKSSAQGLHNEVRQSDTVCAQGPRLAAPACFSPSSCDVACEMQTLLSPQLPETEQSLRRHRSVVNKRPSIPLSAA